MAAKWNWDEFDAEHSIVLKQNNSVRFTNFNFIRFFAKHGTITSFARLKYGKGIAIAKYASKSDAQDALDDDNWSYYGLEVKKISEHPMHRRFDISMYSYKDSREINHILKGHSTDSEDEPMAPVANANNRELSSEPKVSPCASCSGEHCMPNECLTKAWIENHSQSDVKVVVDDPLASAMEFFEDELVEPPKKSTKLDAESVGIDMVDMNNQTTIPELQIPNKSKVYLTHASSSNTVYVRSGEKNDERAYIKLIKETAECCENAAELEYTPEPGAIIAALFDRIYYRCRVVYVSPHTDDALVDFIDFGNVEKIQLSKARTLPQELQVIKPTVKMITLKGVPSKDAKALKRLKSLVNKLWKLTLVNENGETECELIDEKKGVSINAILRGDRKMPAEEIPVAVETKTVTKSAARLPKSPKPQEPQLKDIEYVLTDGRDVSVLTITNSLLVLGYIQTILESDMEKFKINDELVNEIGRKMESLPPYSATIPGELCLVKMYDEYYRAILTDSKYKGLDRYEFIDYGYNIPVKKKNVRRLPDDLLFPCITLKCFLEELPPINTKKSKITIEDAKMLQKRWPQYELLTLKRMKTVKSYNCCVCSVASK